MKWLIGLALLGGVGIVLHNNGVLYNLTHELQPEPARNCKVGGPMKDGTYLALAKEDAKYLIDTHIGNPNDRLNSLRTLSALVAGSRAVQLPENTEVKVISNASTTLYGCKYDISKVKVLHGDLANTTGWVERDTIVDSPLFALYQSMRASKSKTPRTLPAAVPDEPDPISKAQFASRRAERRVKQMQADNQ